VSVASDRSCASSTITTLTRITGGGQCGMSYAVGRRQVDMWVCVWVESAVCNLLQQNHAW
jgi:hypothetical protein